MHAAAGGCLCYKAALHPKSAVGCSSFASLPGPAPVVGWTTSLTWPPEPRGLIMVYPHTSNWDFLIGVLFRVGRGLPAHWMGKDSMFRWPVRRLFLRIGGVPINRRAAHGVVAPCRSNIGNATGCGWPWLRKARVRTPTT